MANGRPPKYKTEKELADALIVYFKECAEDHAMPNKAGLCVASLLQFHGWNRVGIASLP